MGLKELLEGRFTKVLSNKLGKTSLSEHRIETESSKPVRLLPYRLPHEYRDSVKKELAEMECNGIIEPACSKWASPLVVAKKKSGELRLCIDYRRLNAVTQFDTYLMPRIEELIDRVGRAKFITTLYLTTGYWQILVSTKDRRKTAFATPFGTFQFNVMPFGLSGAPATFQRGCEDFAVAYIDDCAIFSNEWKDHINHLQEMLTRLEKAGLTMKLSKSNFAMQSCEYLGHSIGNGVIKPIFNKIEAVRSFPKPDTTTAYGLFLFGYYWLLQAFHTRLRLSGSPFDGPDNKIGPKYCALE